MSSDGGRRQTGAVLQRIEKWLLSGILAALVLCIALQVVNRYLAKSMGGVTAWTEELALFLLLWVTFLGAVVITRGNEHLEMKSIVQSLPRRARVAIGVLTDILTIGFLSLLVWKSFPVIGQNMSAITPMLQTSQAWWYAAPALGSLLMLVYVIVRVVQRFRNLRMGE